MRRVSEYLLLAATCFSLLAPAAHAEVQTSDVPRTVPSQDYCVTVMSGFPNDDMVARYQFFRLTRDMALDATPEFRTVLKTYADADVTDETPVLTVLENIANPVLRQAAPEVVVASMEHLINFSQTCRPLIDGQVSSLLAYDKDLSDSDTAVQEDALFLRQVLSDSLSRLGAEAVPSHAPAMQAYARSLISARDAIEFAAFTSDIADIEAMYLVDLDGRLARSNDMINSEMDREITQDSITLSQDMNKAAKKKDDQEKVYTLLRILGQY